MPSSRAPRGARAGPFVGHWSRSGWVRNVTNGSGYAVRVILDAGEEAKTAILANELRKDREGQRVCQANGLRLYAGRVRFGW